MPAERATSTWRLRRASTIFLSRDWKRYAAYEIENTSISVTNSRHGWLIIGSLNANAADGEWLHRNGFGLDSPLSTLADAQRAFDAAAAVDPPPSLIAPATLVKEADGAYRSRCGAYTVSRQPEGWLLKGPGAQHREVMCRTFYQARRFISVMCEGAGTSDGS